MKFYSTFELAGIGPPTYNPS